jgi:hypothetical protein
VGRMLLGSFLGTGMAPRAFSAFAFEPFPFADATAHAHPDAGDGAVGGDDVVQRRNPRE